MSNVVPTVLLIVVIVLPLFGKQAATSLPAEVTTNKSIELSKEVPMKVLNSSISKSSGTCFATLQNSTNGVIYQSPCTTSSKDMRLIPGTTISVKSATVMPNNRINIIEARIIDRCDARIRIVDVKRLDHNLATIAITESGRIVNGDNVRVGDIVCPN